MKILFTFTGLGNSGASKMIAWVANQMAAKGHQVYMVTLFSGNRTQVLDESIKVYSLKNMRSKSRLVRNTLGMAKTILQFHKKVRDIKPDIVVSFLDSVSYVYLPIGHWFTKSKFVVSERVDPYSYHGNIAKLRFFLMKFADGFVFQTEGARKFFEKYPEIHSDSVVIPNPVVLKETVREMRNRIPSYNERDNRIVTVGRLSLRQKRQDVLLEAFRIFHEKHPEFILEIYGSGQDMTRIQDIIDTSGLSDCARLMGSTDKVEESIFRASAFVLSSDYEGIPNALIESMSVGVPSVSTDCSPGGAALLIKDGENGFIVPRGDAAAIAEKLSVVISDEEISNEFSKNGPLITTDYSEDVISNKWEKYFKEVLEEKERKNAKIK